MTILKDYYNIPIELHQPYFQYQNQLYHLIQVEHLHTFMHIYSIYYHYMSLLHLIPEQIIKNKYNHIQSQNYILLICHHHTISILDYTCMLLRPLPQTLFIEQIKQQWMHKSNELIKKRHIYAYYYVGLIENAMNILNIIIHKYPHSYIHLGLSLKNPIKQIEELFNPANYIISTRIRIMIFMIESSVMNFNHLKELIEKHYFNEIELYYLYARIIYPPKMNKKSITLFKQDVSKHLNNVTNMYLLLSKYVEIPKISWINIENVL